MSPSRCRDEAAEAVVGLRNVEVVGWLVDDLKEQPGVGTAFVELSVE